MFDNIRKLLNRGARKKSFVGSDGNRYAGANYGSTFSFYKGLSYDNTYSSVSKIANEFMTIRPFAIDANGKQLDEVRIIDKLYHPNQQMSSADFREALAVMALVHRKVYLLLWREEDGKAVAGGTVTPDNIAGFTFLEGVSEIVTDGHKTYRVGSKAYTTSDVIEIYAGVDPNDLSRGYSPSVAAAKWANLDDYIAAYEAGLFENGAVPAGEFIITAGSVTQFNEIVDEMQRKHRGSGKNNNVIYTHRPVSKETGKPVDAQVQWVPFAQSNKEMSLEQIFKQANDKIDSAFGVPASIRGVNDNNTYASVRVDEQIFIKYAVYPFAIKIWTRFTHEMNRVTGGLGCAITFELDIPGVADEEKVEAEKKKIELEIIKESVSAGFSLDSTIEAFKLSNSYKTLKQGYKAPVIQNDKPEVDEGDEVDTSPDSTGNQNNSKVISPSKTESGDGHCGHSCNHKVAEPDDPDVVEDVAKIVREYMQKQIDQSIEGNDLTSKDVNDMDEKDITAMVTAILAVLTTYMLIRGQVSYTEGIALLKANSIAVDKTTEYIVSEIAKSEYRAYLTNVAHSYATDTANHIRDILAQGQTMGWDKETIAQGLRDIMETDEWRVQRLARTEEHRSVSQSSVDSMRQLMNETGTRIYKVWHAHGGACEFCVEMDNKKELVTRSFLPFGSSIEGADGGTFLNDFVNIDSASLHPNCHCYVTYEVESNA